MNTPTYASVPLYVGDLHADINEAQLFESFKVIGPIASIRVCRDVVTRRSLGYAYVNFHNYVDAERALDVLNYTEMKGRPMRIMWSQRDPSARRSNVGNVFIKNLHREIDNKMIYDTFSSFGQILSAKVATDENGVSKGYGFVHYETQEAADLAITKVNGMLLCGKRCFVGTFIPRKERQKNEKLWTNLYVKYLDKIVDEEQLRKMFEPFGTITSAVIMRDEKGESKGFGFVNFGGNEEAQMAIDKLNDTDTSEGKKLYVGRAQKKSEREKELKDMFMKIQRERLNKYQGVNLYVKNLDESIDDEKLRQEFAPLGTITSAKVMLNDKGQSKGFGFVCFSTPTEATKAVTQMNGKMIAAKPIYVALAQRKEQRRQQLVAQFAAASAQKQAAVVYPPGGAVFYPPQAGFAQPMFRQRGPPRGPRFPGQPGRFQPPFPVAPVQPQLQQPQQQQQQQQPPGQPGPQAQQRAPKYSRARAPQYKVVSQTAPVIGYPGIEYSPNVRNQQVRVPAPMPLPQVNQIPEDQRNMLGETLFPLIEVVLKVTNQDALTGKVTGMLLESMEASELLQLIQSSEALNKKIVEALEVLQAHSNSFGVVPPQ